MTSTQLLAPVVVTHPATGRTPVDARSRRLLMATTVLNAVGTGAYVPVALVLLTTLTGLGLAAVGLGLTVAQLVALPLMPLSGALVDRLGARRLQIGNQLARATGFALYPVAHDMVTFVVLAMLVAAGDRCSRVAAPALAAAVMPAGERNRYVTLDRSLSNAGLGVGGVVAAVLGGGGSIVFVATSVGASAVFVLGAVLTASMRIARPIVLPCPTGDCATGTYRQVWGDRSLRTLAAANTLSAFGYSALTMLVPLYVVRVLHAPVAVGAAMFTVNTVVCAVLGVPLMTLLRGRGWSTSVIARIGLATMTLGFVIMGAAGVVADRGGAVTALMIVAIVIYSLGEVCHSPAATALVLDRSDDSNRGRYLGIYQMAWALAFALSPLVFTSVIVALPPAAIAGVVLLNGVAFALLARVAR